MHTLYLSGPVTCLSVSGPDQGGGRPGAPTTAVVNFHDATFEPWVIYTVEFVDNGGDGADLVFWLPLGRQPTDCSQVDWSVPAVPLRQGRAVVYDAPLWPTSKVQCKRGGWQAFGSAFRNQGQCVAFAERGSRAPGG